MYKGYSKEQLVRVVGAVFMIGTIFGVNFTDQGVSVDQVVDAIVTLTAAAGILFEAIGYILRWMKGDVTLGGFRK